MSSSMLKARSQLRRMGKTVEMVGMAETECVVLRAQTAEALTFPTAGLGIAGDLVRMARRGLRVEIPVGEEMPVPVVTEEP